MIDLTPLDVRKKRGDFRKGIRGYDPQEVDSFLELVAERFEEIVKENMALTEVNDRLSGQVSSQEGRLKAVQEALVTAQELRAEVKKQAEREAELIRQEAEAKSDKVLGELGRRVEESRSLLRELERKRLRYVHSYRRLLEGEMDAVAAELERPPLDEGIGDSVDVEGVVAVLSQEEAADGDTATTAGEAVSAQDKAAHDEVAHGEAVEVEEVAASAVGIDETASEEDSAEVPIALVQDGFVQDGEVESEDDADVTEVVEASADYDEDPSIVPVDVLAPKVVEDDGKAAENVS